MYGIKKQLDQHPSVSVFIKNNNHIKCKRQRNALCMHVVCWFCLHVTLRNFFCVLFLKFPFNNSK